MTKTMGFLQNENEKSKTHNIPPMDFKHVLITGATGSGKTASIVMPTVEDRIKQNNALIFFEFKGHEHKKLKALAIKYNRLNDVIELGKPTGAYFNILSLFDSRLIYSAIVKLCGGSGKDPYWSISAGQLGVRIIELHRKLYTIGHILIDTFSIEEDIFTLFLTENEPDDYSSMTIHEEPSFASLSKIMHKPETLTQFFIECRNLLNELKGIVKRLHKQHYQDQILLPYIQELVAEVFIFEDMVNRYTNFGLNADNGEAGGNNGVFQLLNNAITTLATVDSINSGETDLMKKLEENAIIILDMQSIPEGIYSIFIDAVLQKLTARLKYGIPKNVSIFIDEANRVLSETVDLHNDVLREARVELILAVQNQEQMILKFGETKWQAIVENILHHYHVDNEHQVFHDGQALPKILPFIFPQRVLEIAEKKYNSLEHNHMYLVSRFIYKGLLAKYFTILFNSNTFFNDQKIELITMDGETIILKYIGAKIKEKTALELDIFYEKLQEKEEEKIYEEIEINISDIFTRR